jgi:glycosyltransferase involved in cell wall biosynthesis
LPRGLPGPLPYVWAYEFCGIIGIAMNLDPGNASIHEILERIERRQAAAEWQVEELRKQVFALRRRSWRQQLSPQLWNFHQYPPRTLSVPQSYDAETPAAETPSIALVTPSFNQAEFLGATIESVRLQNYPALTYHVQDGNSTDGTCDLLKSHDRQLRWHSESDEGQANAINRGFKRADGSLMGYLNSDDVLLPGALSYVARWALARPDVDIFYGHRIFIDASGKEIGRCVLPRHDPVALEWSDYIPQETMFWRRRVWDKIGPFDESLEFALDWDFIMRAQTAGFRFMRLPRFLACFRVHAGQKTFLLADTGREESAKIQERYIRGGRDRARRAFRSYLRRQGIYHRLYKLGILEY